MPAGRPLKFESVEEVQELIEAYFLACDDDEKPRPYTITGLALALDTCRQTLLDYENKDEFSDTIKKAKNKIHNYAEERLYSNNVAGVIFNLKNNFGWKDKTEVDNNTRYVDKEGEDLHARDKAILKKLGIKL